MSDREDSSSERLRADLNRCQRLRDELDSNQALARVCRALGTWQRERLSRTHRDLLASDRYQPAARFFLDEVYAAKDLAERDRDVARVLPIMTRVLPGPAVAALATAVEIDALTRELDAASARVLLAEGVDSISPQSYVEAYRQCDNHGARKYQIELVSRLGRELEEIVTNRLICTALRMARRPARAAGLGDLQDFFERGFSAMQHMGEPRAFVETIVRRETEVLERIFSRHPDPFAEL